LVKRHWQRSDALVIGCYVLTAAYVTWPRWIEPALRVGRLGEGDPSLFQWFMAHAVRVVTHMENPLFTHMMNAPDGVNMMANTSSLGLAIPLVPVTLQFGPHVSVLILLTLGPIVTAAAWYFVLSRYVVRSTFAAAIGGWFCGFAPAMIAHANWHPNFTFQLLVPFTVMCVMRLREPGRAWRNGVVLGLLVVYQAFISQEVLFLTALGCGVFLLGWVIQRPRDLIQVWRPMLASLCVTTIVAGTLLAYPLWMQFFGPHHYGGLHPAHEAWTLDLASFSAFGTESVAGNGDWITPNSVVYPDENLIAFPTEENTFFGWPMLIVAGVAFVLVRGSRTARALIGTALVFALLGIGGEIRYWGKPTGIPGPWRLLEHLPVFDSLLVTRMGLVITAVLGILLALATQRVWELSRQRQRPLAVRTAWVAALVFGLVPAAPTPVDVTHQQPVPRFFTEGSWRSYVDDDETILPLPFPTPYTTTGMRWQAATRLRFAIPNGYFLYPENGVDGSVGIYGAPFRPTSLLLDQVQRTGVPPTISDVERLAARVDLDYWRAAIVVLPAAEPSAHALRTTVEDLIGPPRRVDDVWIWEVRDGVKNSSGLG
jgi:hypothetical protein